mmetsp:Transcript_78577/g.139422  ORF Transcript_78577/g.139422 Transcript_78577/m.139422 type:complete len:563 (-) Transcript_78577:280-1968(-)
MAVLCLMGHPAGTPNLRSNPESFFALQAPACHDGFSLLSGCVGADRHSVPMSSSGEAAGQDHREAAGQDNTMRVLLEMLQGDNIPRDSTNDAVGSGQHQPFQEEPLPISPSAMAAAPLPTSPTMAWTTEQWYQMPSSMVPSRQISIDRALQQAEEQKHLEELLRGLMTSDDRPNVPEAGQTQRLARGSRAKAQPSASSQRRHAVPQQSGSSSSSQPYHADEDQEGERRRISLEAVLAETPLAVVGSSHKADQVYNSLRSCIPGMTLQEQAVKDQERWNERIINWLLQGSSAEFFKICRQQYGCKIVQRAVEVAMSDQRKRITKALEPHVAEVWEDANANFVLEKCIQVLPVNCVRFVLEKMSDSDNAIAAATSKFGCRVLMRLIEHFVLDTQLHGLRKIEDVLIQEDAQRRRDPSNPSNRLINDKFANYVFQSFIEHHAANTRVVDEVLCMDIHMLSKMKFSSHVVSLVLDAQDVTEIALFHRDKVRAALLQDTEKFQELRDLQWGSFVFKQASKLLPSPNAGARSRAVGSNPRPGQKGKGRRHRGRPPLGSARSEGPGTML